MSRKHGGTATGVCQEGGNAISLLPHKNQHQSIQFSQISQESGGWGVPSLCPHQPGPAGGQPAITVVTSISDGILPRPVVTPFSFLTGDSGAAASGTRGAVRGTPPPRGRSADFGPVVWGQTVILNPCAAGGLLDWKRAVREGGSAEVSENCSTALGTTHSAGKLLKNMYFCSLLTSEAGVSLAGAAGQPGVRPRGCRWRRQPRFLQPWVVKPQQMGSSTALGCCRCFAVPMTHPSIPANVSPAAGCLSQQEMLHFALSERPW